MRNGLELLDDFSLATQLEELGRLYERYATFLGDQKKKSKFMNATSEYINVLAIEFANRRLDAGICQTRFSFFPDTAKLPILAHALEWREFEHEINPVYQELRRIADSSRGGCFSAQAILYRNLDKIRNFMTTLPPYLDHQSSPK